MLGLMLMQLLTPPALPSIPSLTWSITTYTPTASPHHHTFTSWDFTLPTPPLPVLLLLLGLLCYALHRHEDRQRRAIYEGIFLHPTVPNAKVHIATSTTSAITARDDGKQANSRADENALNQNTGTRHEWRVDDYSCGYTRSTTASFAAATTTPLIPHQSQQQSHAQPHQRPLPQPAAHPSTQIRSAEWRGSYRETVQTYTARPSAPAPAPAGNPYATRSIFPPMPARALTPARAPQHSSLPLPPASANARSHSHLLIQPYSPYSHPITHATPPPPRPARTIFTNSHNAHPYHRPRVYLPPLYRATAAATSAPEIRHLGRSAISKPPATVKPPHIAAAAPAKYRPLSAYPRRHLSPDEDEKDHQESDIDAMDIDLPTPPSTPPPATELELEPTHPAAQSPGRAARPTLRRRPHSQSAKPRLRRVPKKEPVHRTRGGRIVKSKDGEGRDWVLGFVLPRYAGRDLQKGKKALGQTGMRPVAHARVMSLRMEARGERAVGTRRRWGCGRRGRVAVGGV